MITEDYVSFETAKLLEEKDFDIGCRTYYHTDKSIRTVSEGWYNQECVAPTQALVLKWLRIKHNIHITWQHWTNQPVGDENWKDCYQAFVDGDAMDVRIFKTPEEATEAAILYTLQNLIK